MIRQWQMNGRNYIYIIIVYLFSTQHTKNENLTCVCVESCNCYWKLTPMTVEITKWSDQIYQTNQCNLNAPTHAHILIIKSWTECSMCVHTNRNKDRGRGEVQRTRWNFLDIFSSISIFISTQLPHNTLGIWAIIVIPSLPLSCYRLLMTFAACVFILFNISLPVGRVDRTNNVY